MVTTASGQASPTVASVRRYELIQRLAVGGMAEVFLARAIGIERFRKPVVIKRILPQFLDNDEFVAMFLDEARLAATLHHPNIVQAYDIGEATDGYFFTMEYLHGETVTRVLLEASKQGVPIPLDHAVAIAAGMAAGLHYAHEKTDFDGRPAGIVHRDVSPSNVVVTYDAGVKILDFGIAKAHTAELKTTGGRLKGKISYMSPEQCLGEEVDRRSDVFSLGVVLHQMVTGVRPFDAANDMLAMDRIIEADLTPPSRLRVGMPPALEAILTRALAREPIDRFQTADEMLEALEDLAAGERYDRAPRHLAAYLRSLFGERPDPMIGSRGGEKPLETLIVQGRPPSRPRIETASLRPPAAPRRPRATLPPPTDRPRVDPAFRTGEPVGALRVTPLATPWPAEPRKPRPLPLPAPPRSPAPAPEPKPPTIELSDSSLEPLSRIARRRRWPLALLPIGAVVVLAVAWPIEPEPALTADPSPIASPSPIADPSPIARPSPIASPSPSPIARPSPIASPSPSPIASPSPSPSPIAPTSDRATEQRSPPAPRTPSTWRSTSAPRAASGSRSASASRAASRSRSAAAEASATEPTAGSVAVAGSLAGSSDEPPSTVPQPAQRTASPPRPRRAVDAPLLPRRSPVDAPLLPR